MAERRMFTKKITDSDPFTEMPLSAQALYFHLCMNADDDGFLNNQRKVQRSIGASEDDLRLLHAKRFILSFEGGVIVIKHWRMHNLLRKDRYIPTQYIAERDCLFLKEDGSYTEKEPELPIGNQMATQYSIGKDSIGKDSVITTTTNNTCARACEAPTTIEVFLYFKANVEKNAQNEAEKFYAHNAFFNWDCLPDWKKAADVWIARIER